MAITSSDVDICNVAISALGGKRINALGEATNEGRLCGVYFPFLRDALLADHKWNFASTRVYKQATLATGPLFGWSYAYQLPSNCLRVLDTEDEDMKWIVEQDQLFADYTEVSYRYIFRQTDVSKWSAGFALAMAKGMEALLSIPLTGRGERQQQAWADFKQVYQLAKGVDGQEGFPSALRISELEDVR